MASRPSVTVSMAAETMGTASSMRGVRRVRVETSAGITDEASGTEQDVVEGEPLLGELRRVPGALRGHVGEARGTAAERPPLVGGRSVAVSHGLSLVRPGTESEVAERLARCRRRVAGHGTTVVGVDDLGGAVADDQAAAEGRSSGRRTYLLLDGENIDATLGLHILGHRPNPEDRPRWDRVLSFVESEWDQPVKALFFVNASSGSMPMPFIQALLGMGYTPVPLSGPPGVKVVDVGIQRTLEALVAREGDVMLSSHDADFVPHLRPLLGERRVALLAFREFVSGQYAELIDEGCEVFDLEDDAACFTHRLPRLRVIPLDEFDPLAFL